jgi:hypothetical protein
MTAFGHEERVQESGVVGHSYDTDDRLEDLTVRAGARNEVVAAPRR